MKASASNRSYRFRSVTSTLDALVEQAKAFSDENKQFRRSNRLLKLRLGILKGKFKDLETASTAQKRALEEDIRMLVATVMATETSMKESLREADFQLSLEKDSNNDLLDEVAEYQLESQNFYADLIQIKNELFDLQARLFAAAAANASVFAA